MSVISSADSEAAAAKRAVTWHAFWLAALIGAGAVITVLLGALPLSLYAAFGAMALAGALGFVLKGRTLLVCWAAAATLAASAAGGIVGPGVIWLLTPFAAAAVLRRPLRETVVLAVLAFAVTATAQMAGVSPEPPEGWRAGLTMLASIGTTGWAFATTLLRRRPDEDTAAVTEEPAAEATPEAAPERSPAVATPAAEAGPSADLAELQRRLEEAETTRAEAEAANAAKSRFLANMSHELRTPLNAIMGFADIMRNRLFGPLPDRYQDYAQLIHESGRHLLDLINDVLDMSKIEADRYTLSREVFDGREAVTAVLRLMRPQAEEARIDLRAVLPEGLLAVDADKRAVKQIALNLISNALKFTPPGGSVTVGLSAVDGQLELTVTDTGAGIAAEDIERLGRPFEQAGDADMRAQGTGLGLSLVRAFAGLHGGEMSIESALGDGTAVYVRLPVLTDAAPPEAAGAQVIPFAQR